MLLRNLIKHLLQFKKHKCSSDYPFFFIDIIYIFILVQVTFYCSSLHALNLSEAYQLALTHDVQFQSAQAEWDINQALAKQAKTAYLPEASYNRLDVPTEKTPVQTLTLTQPLFNLNRYATFKQAEPRKRLAIAAFQLRQQELSTKLLVVVNELVRTRENAVLHQAKMTELKQQYARAQRMYDLGHGTITDVRDTQVQYQQAQADQIINEVDIQVAEKAFFDLTGVIPASEHFALPLTEFTMALEPLDFFQQHLEQANPAINMAWHNIELKKLDAQRVQSNLLPSVYATYSRSSYSNTLNITTGLTVSIPLNFGNYYALRAATAETAKANIEHQSRKQQLKRELERVYALFEAGQQALKIQRNAITSAELSVEANRKSYEGGIRSNIDVVNSIQVLFKVKNQHVITLTKQAENLLKLLLLAGYETDKSMALVQHFLFRIK